MNAQRSDGNQDPDSQRTVGDLQQDAVQEHKHETSAANLPAYGDPTTDLGYTSTGDAHAPRATVTNVKDAKAATETRPKNVAVYYYIKVQ
jgi:hypothetical protein